MAIGQVITTILFYFDKNILILQNIFAISIVPLYVLYMTSYSYKFCEIHRIPLHFIVMNIIFRLLEEYTNITIVMEH